MIIGVVKETTRDERRVALVPAAVPPLARAGLEVRVESGAGAAAGFSDAEYEARGAVVVTDRREVIGKSDILLMIHGPAASAKSEHDLPLIRARQIVIGILDPYGGGESLIKLARSGATAFALELVPRITRAQSMDVLSSQATIAGYKAVLLAADNLPRMFPMLTTAAGTITPAKVFIIGAGVAGLQAIATARRLGAVVHAYDVRPAVKEQVQSLGARFVELPLATESAEGRGGYAKEMSEEFYRAQRETMARVVAESSVVITTALIPGKPAPVLITAEMVKQMAAGSVIVDLAAEHGGNCELTRADEAVVEGGVTIFGPTNLPATIPYHASQMYAKNITTFLLNIWKKGELKIDTGDEIVRETLLTRDGEIVHGRIREILGLGALEPAQAAAAEGI
jgi:NAD(P) transhydrogenase subunit alpha